MAGFGPVASTPIAALPGGGAVILVAGTVPGNLSLGALVGIQFSASGGTAPYTWAVLSGSLPTGLSLNASTGLLSGYPTATGSFTFSVKATDAGASVGASSLFTVVVVNQAEELSVLTTRQQFGPYSFFVRTRYGQGTPLGSAPARVTWVGVEVFHPIPVRPLPRVVRPNYFPDESDDWPTFLNWRRQLYPNSQPQIVPAPRRGSVPMMMAEEDDYFALRNRRGLSSPRRLLVTYTIS